MPHSSQQSNASSCIIDYGEDPGLTQNKPLFSYVSTFEPAPENDDDASDIESTHGRRQLENSAFATVDHQEDYNLVLRGRTRQIGGGAFTSLQKYLETCDSDSVSDVDVDVDVDDDRICGSDGNNGVQEEDQQERESSIEQSALHLNLQDAQELPVRENSIQNDDSSQNGVNTPANYAEPESTPMHHHNPRINHPSLSTRKSQTLFQSKTSSMEEFIRRQQRQRERTKKQDIEAATSQTLKITFDDEFASRLLKKNDSSSHSRRKVSQSQSQKRNLHGFDEFEPTNSKSTTRKSQVQTPSFGTMEGG